MMKVSKALLSSISLPIARGHWSLETPGTST